MTEKEWSRAFSELRLPTHTLPEPLGSAIASLVERDERLVLAVSGGVDSMVLLHVVARAFGALGPERLVVATFDHGTGTHSLRAADFVRHASASLALRCVSARASSLKYGEASWREARWRFLKNVAAAESSLIATAHTRDDQVETVVMRILRGSGARGIAALYASSDVLRPLLYTSRSEVLALAREHAITWCDDPTNHDLRFFRNRVRHDLLPAMLALRPGIDAEFLSLARRAALMRESLRAVTDTMVTSDAPGRVEALVPPSDSGGRVATGAAHLSANAWSVESCALFWQTVAERAGLALDRRATERLVRYSVEGRVGSRIPLSAGYEALRRRQSVEVRRCLQMESSLAPLSVKSDTVYGMWRFRPLPDTSISPTAGEAARDDSWSAWLPRDSELVVRAWHDGDRMVVGPSGRTRRVKRFFSDQRVLASDREGWPVIVADGDIVWIPGIRRGEATTDRSERPRVRVACERLHG